MYRKILQLLGVKRIDFETGIAGRFMHIHSIPPVAQFIASVAIHVLEHVLCFDPCFIFLNIPDIHLKEEPIIVFW
jgi:hypothetical protein